MVARTLSRGLISSRKQPESTDRSQGLTFSKVDIKSSGKIEKYKQEAAALRNFAMLRNLQNGVTAESDRF
jgi:hypothetical protein